MTEIPDLPMPRHETLIAAARTAREHAHAPYSNFRVGAALHAHSGRIFTGCNIESASYGLSMCAERVAVWKALSEGERGFDAVAIVTDREGDGVAGSAVLTPPCGACRQILWEFCGDADIILSNLHGRIEVHRLSALLPRPFDSSSL